MAKLSRAAVIAATAVLMIASSVTPAAAATARNGICEVGEFCLYWLENREDSVSDFAGSIPNYGDPGPNCYEFKGAGYGQGTCVKNNAQSAWNRTTHWTVEVYVYSNYGHPKDTIYPGTWRNLVRTYDDNACHRFIPYP